jgi:tetratricopeptide (TPR) repeat protein
LHRVPEPFRTELEVAGDLCHRAAALDPADADVWAAWSHVESWYVAQSIDQSTVRRESARAKAARAMSLAPESYEARLAYACSLLRSQGFNKPSVFTPEAEALLRTLVGERPTEPRTLLALGHLLYGRGQVDESVALFDRLARQPGWEATAHNGKGWVLFSDRRHDEAIAAAERSIAAKPFFGNLGLVAYVARTWMGDLDAAKNYVERLSAAELREDIGLGYAVQVYWWRREAKAMHHLLRNAPRDWLASGAYWGPRDYWVGVAYQLEGNREAAQFAWRKALRLVDERLAREPGIEPARLQVQKARLLALLGEQEASRAAFAALRQLGTDGPQGVDAALLGDATRALPSLRNAPWATLRYLPDLDNLRDHPDFQALLAEAANDPRRSPHVKPASR